MTWEEAVNSSSLQVAYRVDEDVVHFRFPRTGTVEMRLGEPLVVENLYDRMDDWLPFGVNPNPSILGRDGGSITRIAFPIQRREAVAILPQSPIVRLSAAPVLPSLRAAARLGRFYCRDSRRYTSTLRA
jgi:hypothetical protein